MVFADDGSDANIFCRKVLGNLKMTAKAAISQIIQPLTPKVGELVINKTLPSAFFAANLNAWLTSRGVRTVIIAGAMASGCIRASVVDAMCFGFIPVVAIDCVGDRSVQQHDSSLFICSAEICGIDRFWGIKALALAWDKPFRQNAWFSESDGPNGRLLAALARLQNVRTLAQFGRRVVLRLDAPRHRFHSEPVQC